MGAECINQSRMLYYFIKIITVFLTYLDILLVSAIVASHIEKCRKLSFLRNSLAIVIPESNLPTIAQHLVTGLKDLQVKNCIFMNEDNNPGSAQRNDLPGSYTTRNKKSEMVLCLKEDYFRKHRIVFYQDFIVAEKEYSVVEDVKVEFVKQLRGFCQKRKQTTARDGSIYFENFYLGKIGGILFILSYSFYS